MLIELVRKTAASGSRRILLTAVLAFLPAAANALESRSLAQYSHRRVTVEGPVLALAQGRNGFLWLATGDGLLRYDGDRFERIEAEGTPGEHTQPGVLLATRNGDIWTNFGSSGHFGVYRSGSLRVLKAPAPYPGVRQMVEGSDGAVWIVTASYDAELLRFHQGSWRKFDARDGLPLENVNNIQISRDGAVWIATRSMVVRMAPGSERFEALQEARSAWLSQDPAGRIWATDRYGSRPISAPDGGSPGAPASAVPGTGDSLRDAPVFDREGNLWIATSYRGLRYVGTPGDPDRPGQEVESFTVGDGLSSSVVHQILPDREGNLWMATEGGLDVFRPAALVREPTLDWPARFGDRLLRASDGSVYIGQARAIHRVRPGQAPAAILQDVLEPQSLCEAGDGALWIVLEATIIVWAEGAIRETIARPDIGTTHNFAFDCAFDNQEAFWMSASGSGVHRYADGQWTRVLEPGDDAESFPTSMVRSPQGGMVIQTGQRLVWLESGTQRVTHLAASGPKPAIVTLHASKDAVFASGAFGLVRHRQGRMQTAVFPSAYPRLRINGMVTTAEGDIWLAFPKSVIRLTRSELEQAFTTGQMPLPLLTTGRGYSLPIRPHGHSLRTVVQGGDGRIWIATQTGSVWIDPARNDGRDLPPGVTVTSLDADGHFFRDPSRVTLPAGTTKIAIDFSVLCLSEPDRVRARYILEGFDPGWADSGSQRQVSYTNLPPGTYRFRVIAANNDGAWNQKGAEVVFDIPPTAFQSVWFWVLIATAIVAVLSLLYRVRIAQLASGIHARLEERTMERERIARELHDTLLQGVQGLILRFQAASELVSETEPARARLESALVVADDIVVEARNKVQDLRVPEDGDLCTAIEKLVPTIPFDPPITVRIVIEGKPRRLDPIVASEISRVAREALLNIAHHAHSSRADIALGFERKHLALRVRDYGVGMPSHVLARGGKEGHYGLPGMRERAERIGGTLTITTSAGEGTELTLVLPAKLAYRKPARRMTWLGRTLSRRRNL